MRAPIAASAPSASSSTAASSPRCAGAPLESDIIIVNHHLFCADLAIKAADGPLARCRRAARRGRRGLRRSARTGRRRGRLLRRDRVESAHRRPAARCGAHAAPRRHSRGRGAAGIRPGARAFAIVLCDPAAGRRPLCLRESRGVSGRKWRRVSRPAECAERISTPSCRRIPEEAGRSARDDAPRRRTAHAARLRHGSAAEATRSSGSSGAATARISRRAVAASRMYFCRPRRSPSRTFCATRCSSIWSRRC